MLNSSFKYPIFQTFARERKNFVTKLISVQSFVCLQSLNAQDFTHCNMKSSEGLESSFLLTEYNMV